MIEIAKCLQKAIGPDREIDCMIFEWRNPQYATKRVTYYGEPTGEYVDSNGQFSVVAPRYTGDINAAKMLLEELVPNCCWQIRNNVSADGDCRYRNAQIWMPASKYDEDNPRWWANHDTSEALALLTATFKAIAHRYAAAAFKSSQPL